MTLSRCSTAHPSQEAIDRDTRTAGPAQPRRAAHRRPRPAGLRSTRPAQRASRQHHRHHHPARAGDRGRHGADRRRHPAADVRRDRPGPPRPPLSGDLRPRQSSSGSTTPNAWPPPANASCSTPTTAAAPIPAATSPATYATSTTFGNGPTAAEPTSTSSPSPAAATTASIKPGGWTTRKRRDGRTEWIPPPQLDRGQPRTNLFHHPERLLRGDDDAQ